ncbi:hypothetical protein B7486_50010 [cyanobacterium TDX16]|nr:hypothetical protein B7486_50010 [cyanobacterium TDX16]
MSYEPKHEPQLDEAAALELRSVLEQVNRPEAVDEVRVLTLANIYLQRSQNVKAIEILEESGIQAATVFLALGDIYRFGGADEQAQENYRKAIEKATTVEDGQVLVAAKAGLARIEAAHGNMEAANHWHREAKDEFESLKDVERWSEVEQRLSSSTSEERSLSSEARTLLFLSGCPVCTPPNGGDGRAGGGGRCRGC